MSLNDGEHSGQRVIRYAGSGLKRRATSRLAIGIYIGIGLLVIVVDAAAPAYTTLRTRLNTLSIFQLANIAEGVLWSSVGLVVALVYKRRTSSLIAIVLLFFGASDWIEAATGAWWRPWWLLVWKLACVAILTVAVVIYWRRRRTSAEEVEDKQLV